MQTITDSIDFDAFIKGPDENAKVKPAIDYMQAVIDRLYATKETNGNRLPWSKTIDKFRVRSGEVTIWPGINGHGKSMIVSQVMVGLMSRGEKVCIASMEMKPVATMARMTRQAARCAEPAIQFIQDFHQWTDKHLWIYDQQGTVKTKRLLSVMRYCSDQIGVTQFVIDSLMKCGMGEDDYNGQKSFIDELCAYARDTGVHVHLIAHSRKGMDEYSAPNKMDK